MQSQKSLTERFALNSGMRRGAGLTSWSTLIQKMELAL